MLPTIRHRGEIVLLDRFTPRLHGLQRGCNGKERARLAREEQKRHEEQLLIHSKSYSKENVTWHEPMIQVNELPTSGAWGRLWNRLTTGVSVGDVVVVQHPDRIGTVCKRVLGLPGDMVTKPSMRAKTQGRRLRRRRSGMVVVPDGHIWLEGDNPWNSSDSRSYGPIPASMIVGRVLLRVWPLRGNALMERGARPEGDESQQTQLTFSGSLVLPAGYDNQVIVRHNTTVEDKKTIEANNSSG
jgi:signal peptidase I